MRCGWKSVKNHKKNIEDDRRLPARIFIVIECDIKYWIDQRDKFMGYIINEIWKSDVL